MYQSSVGYQSPYVHQHQVPVTRHVGSYNLGVSGVSRPYELSSPMGGQQIVQSRVVDGGASYGGNVFTPQGSISRQGGPQQYGQQYGQSPMTIQSQSINSGYNSGVYNPQIKYIGGQGGQVQQQQLGGSVAGPNAIGAGQIQGGSTQQLQQQQSVLQQGSIGIQQQQQQQDINAVNQLGSSNAANINTPGAPTTGGAAIDINNTANFENPNFRGGDFYRNDSKFGPVQFTRTPYDNADRDYYDQDLTQTRRRNPGKIVGPHVYSYDDTDDQRIRKPPDQEHEQKLQKLKSEKTKRELHVQELDYKIHILEQENQSLRNQMEQMKTDYKRLNQVYEEKYSHEIERLHLENQDYENSNKQWATRFKDLVDKCDDLVQEKQDLEDQNRKLNDKILQIQVLLHEQPIKNQMRFENTNKNF